MLFCFLISADLKIELLCNGHYNRSLRDILCEKEREREREREERKKERETEREYMHAYEFVDLGVKS